MLSKITTIFKNITSSVFLPELHKTLKEITKREKHVIRKAVKICSTISSIYSFLIDGVSRSVSALQSFTF